MIEVELKYYIFDIPKILKSLKEIGFDIEQKRTLELSEMFDNESGLMQKTNGRIRVRKIGDRVEFCYKKPLNSNKIKKEIEYETKVQDYEQLINIITEMGFTKTTSYERYRTLLTNSNKIKVTIDEYPFATFLEIEGDEEKIRTISDKLGFNIKDNLVEPCDTLFRKWRIEHSLEPIPNMLFKNPK